MKGPPWSGNLLPLPLAALQTASVSSADCIRELSSSPMKLQESEESFQMLGINQNRDLRDPPYFFHEGLLPHVLSQLLWTH